MSILWDNHMHSSFSSDSNAELSLIIESAKKKGLNGITITDHLDHDYQDEPGMFELDVDDYCKQISSLIANNSTDDFNILLGIEVGLQPHIATYNKKIMTSYDFDFIIGSTHVVDKKDPYYPSFWQGKNHHELLQKYYESILENISSCPYFDTVAHLDYIFRYLPEGPSSESYDSYEEIIEAILNKIINLDKALEVNTGAYAKGLHQPNPCTKIIKRYKELGGKLITIGSDAHIPENIATSFDSAAAILKECGFKEYAVYKKRIPQIYPL